MVGPDLPSHLSPRPKESASVRMIVIIGLMLILLVEWSWKLKVLLAAVLLLLLNLRSLTQFYAEFMKSKSLKDELSDGRAAAQRASESTRRSASDRKEGIADAD